MDPTAESAIKWIIQGLLAIGGLGGVAALVGTLISRRKFKAESDQINQKTRQQVPADAAATLANASATISEEYRKLLDDYQKSTETKISELNVKIAGHQKSISTLEKSLRHYAQRVAYLMTGIQMLTEQLTVLKLTPCWSPNDWKDEQTDPQEKA